MYTPDNKTGMKIYLDDIRPTPNGYIQTYTANETIELIKQNDGLVYEVSLDNDLGIGLDEGRTVMNWIEEEAFNNTLKPIPNLFIHSANPVAVDQMLKARYNTWKYWESHGYKRNDYV